MIRMDRDTRETLQGEVAREYPLTVMLNDEQLATLLCSPDDMENLAVGFLYSEGLIRTKEEIKGVTLDEPRGIVRVNTDTADAIDRELFMKRVITTGCGRGISFYNFADLDQKQQKVESDAEGDARADPGSDEGLPDPFGDLPEDARRPRCRPVRRVGHPSFQGGHRQAQCHRQDFRSLPDGGYPPCGPDHHDHRPHLLGDPVQGGQEKYSHPGVPIDADGSGRRPRRGTRESPSSAMSAGGT